MSICKFCGSEIEWMDRPDGRRVPVDPEPVFVIEGYGGEQFFREEEGDLVGRVAYPEEVRTAEQKENTPVGFVPHRKTCGAWWR